MRIALSYVERGAGPLWPARSSCRSAHWHTIGSIRQKLGGLEWVEDSDVQLPEIRFISRGNN
jgi:hypothetical protein